MQQSDYSLGTGILSMKLCWPLTGCTKLTWKLFLKISNTRRPEVVQLRSRGSWACLLPGETSCCKQLYNSAIKTIGNGSWPLCLSSSKEKPDNISNAKAVTYYSIVNDTFLIFKWMQSARLNRKILVNVHFNLYIKK